MGLFDELKRLTRPYDDRMDEDDYEAEDEAFDDGYDDEPEPAPAPREEPRRREYRQEPPQQPRRNDSGKVVNIHATTQLQVVLVKPERYENASEVADHLRDKRTVVLNLEKTEKEVARRLLDFLSGRGLRPGGQDQEGRPADLYRHPVQRGHHGRSHRRAGEQRAVSVRYRL